MTRIVFVIFLLHTLLLSGCWFGGKPKPKTPAGTTQTPRAPRAVRPVTPAKKSTAKKRKPATSVTRAAQPAAPPKAAETPKNAPAQNPEKPQRLGQILSSDEQEEYRLAYERSCTEAQKLVDGVTQRNLTPEQQASLGRIRSFLSQAHEAVASDLATAAQHAYRAEVLARDLSRLVQ